MVCRGLCSLARTVVVPLRMYFFSLLVLVGAVSYMVRQRALSLRQRRTAPPPGPEELSARPGGSPWQPLPGAVAEAAPAGPTPESLFPQAEKMAVGLLTGGREVAAEVLGPTMGGQSAWELPVPPVARLEEGGDHVVHLTEVPRPQLPPGILSDLERK